MIEYLIALQDAGAQAAAQTPQELVNINEDFFHFIKHLPWQEIIVTWLVMHFGAFMHWVKLAATNKANHNYFKYCIQYPWATLWTGFGLLGSEFAMLGGIGGAQAMTWTGLLYAAFTSGFSFDSLLNKGLEPETSDNGPKT